MTEMQKLMLDPGLMPAAHRGDKKITIRNGWRNMDPGPYELIDFTNEDNRISIDVYSVTKTIARDVPLEWCRADGFDNQDDLVKGMREFYDDFEAWSKVTVFKWR